MSLPFEPEPHRDDLVVLNTIRYHSLHWGPGAYRAHLEDVARYLEGVEISPFNPGAHTSDPKGYAYMSRFVESGRREEMESDLGLDSAGEREFEEEVSGMWILQRANGESLWVPSIIPDYRARIELYFCLVANAYDPYLTFSGVSKEPGVEVWHQALAGSEHAWAHDPIWPRSSTVKLPPPSESARCRERRIKKMIERADEIRGDSGRTVLGAEVIRSMRRSRADEKEEC